MFGYNETARSLRSRAMLDVLGLWKFRYNKNMTAIFVGRFQPFHKGHLAAVKWILKKNGRIFIVIGSIQEFSTNKNPLAFFERRKMIERVFAKEGIKNFEIFGISDTPDDGQWAEEVLKVVNLKKEEVVVFSENEWTRDSFKKLGAKVSDHPFFFNELHATEIRKRIAEGKEWEDLVPEDVVKYLKTIKGEERIRALPKV